MDLNEISVFINVVQLGSFSRAAQRMGMPKSTVSAKLASLENRLGVTLLQRTTRKVDITPTGQAYFEKCSQGLQEIQIAEDEVAQHQGEPHGVLRVTAPNELGNDILPTVVSEYTRRYPHVRVELLLTDRRVDLRSEGFDLAIRAGDLKDSTLIAKKIAQVQFAIFASPAYLRAHGTPSHPRELTAHACVQFTALGREEWRLTSDKGAARVPMHGRILANELNVVRMLALKGDGVALLPAYYCANDVRAKKLAHILAQWRERARPMHFVYPPQRFDVPKRSAFIALAMPVMQRSFRGE